MVKTKIMIGIIVKTHEEKYEDYILDINQTDHSVGFHVFKNSDKNFSINFMAEKHEWEQIKSFIDKSLEDEIALDKEAEEEKIK